VSCLSFPAGRTLAAKGKKTLAQTQEVLFIMRDVLPDIERWRARGERVAIATVVSMAGSAPRQPGAKLAVSESGELSGSVSGGCVEPAVVEAAMEVIEDGRPQMLEFGITEEENIEQIGLACGGTIHVFVERLDW
jgi:xanthine dehydrogenase accessory factor